MKKQLIIALIAGAAVLTFFVLKRKYTKVDDNTIDVQPTPVPVLKKHHLTKAFSNAKKHALHVADNAQLIRLPKYIYGMMLQLHLI